MAGIKSNPLTTNLSMVPTILNCSSGIKEVFDGVGSGLKLRSASMKAFSPTHLQSLLLSVVLGLWERESLRGCDLAWLNH